MNAGLHLRYRGVTQAGGAATAVHPVHQADGTDCRWLTLAAETAGLIRDSGRPAPDACPAGRAGPPRVATCTPGADAGSVHEARDFTLATLHRWEAAERAEDIAIVVTELLTNALRHALPWAGDPPPRWPIRLGLLQPGRCVLCAVADPSRAVPVPRGRRSLAETGRGLQIIRALSDRWGYTVLSDAGKVVWAAFLPATPAASPGPAPGQAVAYVPGQRPVPMDPGTG